MLCQYVTDVAGVVHVALFPLEQDSALAVE